jgi:hypothetical protein
MRTRTACTALLVSLLLATGAAAAQSASSADPSPLPEPVATMSELMVHVLYPASDAIFYIETRTPTTSEEWGALQTSALMLAESANLLMMPGMAWDDQQWMRDALLLRDVGRAAFEAAKARDVQALIDLNDRLYRACLQCHLNYRPDYGRRPRD